MAERSARRRKSSKSVEQLNAEISARDKEKAERAAARKPSGAAAEAQEAARRRRNAGTYEKEKAKRANKGSSGYGYSQHLMGGSSRSSSFNPRSVREEVLVDYLLDEGFASDEKSAEAILGAMSESWIESIVEEILNEEKKEFPSDKVNNKSAKHERDYLNRPNSYVGQSSKLRSKKMKAIKSTVDAGDDPRNTMHGQDLRKIRTRPSME